MLNPEQVLELARRRAEQAEVFFAAVEDTPVAFEANRLKQLQTRMTRGMALRIVKDGRVGIASTSREGDAEQLVEMALEVAPYGAEAKYTLPGAAVYPEVPLFDPAVPAVPVETMVELGQGMVDHVLAAHSELICDAETRKISQQIRLLNSAGADVTYRKTIFRASVSAQRVRGTDMLWVGDGDASCRPITDVSAILATTLRQLEWAQENAPVRTAELPVVFTPDGVASALLAPLLVAFNGKMVLQGSSPLADALGAARYDERLTITDDPLTPWRPGARMVDDEGVPCRPLTLVERGVVKQFLYDLQTAGLAGTESTGSAHRGVGTLPSIGSSVLMISPGDRSFAEIVAGIDEGVVVEQVIGATQGNVLGGEFSGNVVLGYKIEHGRIVGRVKNTMVAGNVHTLLRQIGALGSEARWVSGGLSTPAIMFERVSVASTE